jgi:hypothetical protein
VQILEEPLFNVLRTQKQLGYSTGITPTQTFGVLGLHIEVVSDKGPHLVETEVETFLADFVKTLSSMTDKDFSEHVESLAALRLENHKNISEQTEEHWQAICQRTYDFYERYMVCFSRHQPDILSTLCLRPYMEKPAWLSVLKKDSECVALIVALGVSAHTGGWQRASIEECMALSAVTQAQLVCLCNLVYLQCSSSWVIGWILTCQTCP